ncbi:hypothetical protein [Mycobacterium sp.]|uniref:hypothetical protein n=1 Tax=Mycobacterium sp. TaxID=1785 RepID=UPI0025E40932|nr:hypothetical protein [Mycobacterium sp.]MBW0014410.1 hypothetical protein [Mycobacterium sp.]
MRTRSVTAAIAAIAMATTGFTAGYSPVAQAAPPDETTCYEISFDKDALMLSTTPATARKYADALEKYDMPDSVKSAIEHFVATGGGQLSDPDLDAQRTLIANWLKQMCPQVHTY